jgi:hypothetical protein
MKKHYVIISALTLIVGATMILGCGQASETIAEKVMEKAIEAGTDGKADVNVSKDGEGFTITGTEDGETMTMKMGDQAKLPDNFPKDIPMYEGLALMVVTSMGADEGHMVQGTTADALDKVVAFYKKEVAAKGWKEEMVQSQADVHMLIYSKEKRSLNVTIGKDEDNGGQTFVSMITAK